MKFIAWSLLPPRYVKPYKYKWCHKGRKQISLWVHLIRRHSNPWVRKCVIRFTSVPNQNCMNRISTVWRARVIKSHTRPGKSLYFVQFNIPRIVNPGTRRQDWGAICTEECVERGCSGYLKCIDEYPIHTSL